MSPTLSKELPSMLSPSMAGADGSGLKLSLRQPQRKSEVAGQWRGDVLRGEGCTGS